jgi:hypothetical protein
MVEREKRYNELKARGFYFENEKIFDEFLVKIEELSIKHNTPEINYFHAFEKKLEEIEDNKGVPVVGAVIINLICKPQHQKGSTKHYMISKINVHENKEFEKHNNSRYS